VQRQGARSDTVDTGRAWLIAVAALVANAAGWGTMNSFGAFLPAMTDEFQRGLGATALIYALPSFILFMLGLVAGPLADQVGPRAMLVASAVFLGGGLLLTSHAANLGLAIVAYGVGIGVGMACFLVPLAACIGGWFVRRRALAQGLAAAGSGLGTLVTVPVARWLIDTHGWRVAYRVLAVVCVVSLALATAVTTRPPNQVAAGRPSLRRIRAAASTGPFLTVYLGGLFITGALYVPFVFLVRFATDHGVASRDAALLLSVLGGSNVVSRLVTTGFAGRLGAVRLYLGCFALLPLSLGLWMVAGGSYPLLALFAALLGISHGGYVALGPEVTAEWFGVANLGPVLGALWTAPGMAGLLSPVVAGLAIDAAGYTATIAGAIVLATLGVLVQRPLWSGTRAVGERPQVVSAP